jgi:hypothetical protein
VTRDITRMHSFWRTWLSPDKASAVAPLPERRRGFSRERAEPVVQMRIVLLTLSGLLLVRVALQLLLYASGFMALTADDFARTLGAAQWAANPQPIWSGFWLPFHTYMFGSALFFVPDMLITPRTLAILIGLGGILAIYALTRQLTQSRLTALVAALLLTIDPAHIWLSAVPLTEAIVALLVSLGALGVAAFLGAGQLRLLVPAAFALLLGTGFRYEAWMAAIPFSVTLGVLFVLRVAQGQWRTRTAVLLLISAGLPWIYPLIWLYGNSLATGDPLAFQSFVRSYNLSAYGYNPSYGRYVWAWFQISPAATLLILPCLGFILLRRRQAVLIWYILFWLTTFVIFAVLHGGQEEPQVNSIRYLAQFVFPAYPLLAVALVALARHFARAPRTRTIIVSVIAALFVLPQLFLTFSVPNDPVAEGFPGGRALRDVRAGDEPPPLALVEYEYWQTMAVHVGANDPHAILYDRAPDYLNRANIKSLLLENPQEVTACLAINRIAFVLVRGEELRARAETTLGLPLLHEVNDYAVYDARTVPATQTTCTLAPFR